MISHTPEWMDCDLICPQCSANLFLHTIFPVPVKYETKCLMCDFQFKQEERIEPTKQFTQEEINSYFLEEKKRGVY